MSFLKIETITIKGEVVNLRVGQTWEEVEGRSKVGNYGMPYICMKFSKKLVLIFVNRKTTIKSRRDWRLCQQNVEERRSTLTGLVSISLSVEELDR